MIFQNTNGDLATPWQENYRLSQLYQHLRGQTGGQGLSHQDLVMRVVLLLDEGIDDLEVEVRHLQEEDAYSFAMELQGEIEGLHGEIYDLTERLKILEKK